MNASRRSASRILSTALLAVAVAAAAPARPAAAQSAPRARDLGVPFDGTPGPLDAITDVAGVEVGHVTLVAGSGRLVVGKGPVRTGVTAILPRGKRDPDPVFAGWFTLNGNGEMTGTTWVEESGTLEGPILITNTHSVGVVRDATIQWELKHMPGFLWSLPVVAETWDGVLNDINGFHVKPEHALAALDGAAGGPVREGAVGGGTGMICNGFKGGIGTASRRLPPEAGGWTVGVLVQCNYGRQRDLRIAGVPVGREMPPGLCAAGEAPTQPGLRNLPKCASPASGGALPDRELGSIIIVVATDAPLLPHQLKRLARRTTLGLGREGSSSGNGSGDIFIAFSTAARGLAADTGAVPLTMLANGRLDPIFAATVQATEEAVTNAMVAAETTTGADDVRANRLPHDRLREILAKYGRLERGR
ncbi:MAG TPA: P1 family peptidase [Longimicrobiales bacterium]|nr:P1 family peptidase [Longimicrobiales bacterium]